MVSIDKCLALLSYLMNQNHCHFCFYQINCLQHTRCFDKSLYKKQISEMWSTFSYYSLISLEMISYKLYVYRYLVGLGLFQLCIKSEFPAQIIDPKTIDEKLAFSPFN